MNYFDQNNRPYTPPGATGPQTPPGTPAPPASPYANSYRASYESPHSVSYQPQNTPPPPKKKGRAGKVVASLALVAACGLAGFGGAWAALQSGAAGTPTVVYRSPEGTSEASGVSTGEDLSLADVAAKAQESVVSITTENIVTDFMLGGRVVSGAGSGVIISEDGTIITNHHVISGASNVIVTLPDGSEHEASLIGSDQATDVAVIKIEANGLTPAVLGSSDELRVGEFVFAVGNPMGTLEGTVTDGIISALQREITIEQQPMKLLQMSAAVSPGNSGGGLFNSKGELVGIVNAKSDGDGAEGLGFAIPVNDAMGVADDLITNGHVTGRPALGVQVQTYTAQDAAMAGIEPGVYIMEVNPGGAAERAGLQAEDRIVSVGGQEVSTYADISAQLAEHSVGDALEITVFRGGKLMSFTVTLEEMGQQ